MSQTITLPDPLFHKLVRGADQRGLTVEALLAVLSELVVLPERPTKRDRERSRRIEQFFDRYRTGRLSEQDRAALDQLIDSDYQEAIAQADRRIAGKSTRPETATGRRGAGRRASFSSGTRRRLQT
jgi:hypothetical protein